MANSKGYTRPFKTSEAPCQWCKKYFGGPGLNGKLRKYCSIQCVGAAKYRHKERRCTKCQVSYPVHSYAKVGLRRSKLCPRCYVPADKRVRPLRRAEKPCRFCHKPIIRAIPYSRLKLLKYCGRECQRQGQTERTRRCRSCGTTQPRANFDYSSDARSRNSRCKWCYDHYQATKIAAVGHMLDVAHAIAIVTQVSKARGVPNTIPRAQLEAMYGKPCIFCGAPGCIYRRSYPELGFIEHNVDVVCWVCSKWCRPYKTDLSVEDVVAHAQKIVAHCV